MNKEIKKLSDASRKIADANASEKTSSAPSIEDAVIRTYAKDLAQASGKPETKTQNQIPEKTKAHPGIPLDLVIMKREQKEAPEKQIKSSQIPTTPENKINTDANKDILEQMPIKETLVLPENNSKDIKLPEKTINEPPLPKPPTKPEPIITPIEKTPKKKPSSTEGIPSPIHTYKSDFVDKMHKTGASHVEILAEEQDAGKTAPSQKTLSHMHTLLFSIGGVLLFAASVLGVMYAYQYRMQISRAPKSIQAQSLIASDFQQKLSGSGNTLIQKLREAEDNMPDGTIKIAYLVSTSTNSAGKEVSIPQTGGDFITALNIPIPSLLRHTIAHDSTIGIVHSGSKTSPFFILHVGSYDSAFAGMLRWEKTIAHDLAIIYPAYPKLKSTVNSTSTPQKNTSPIFKDEIISNHDTRVLRDVDGRSILLYGFWNKNILIIARTPVNFAEILSRLGNSSTQ